MVAVATTSGATVWPWIAYVEQLDADHPSNNGWRIVSLGVLPRLKYHSVPAARDRNDVTVLAVI